ncbi:DNA repair protein RadC [Listeria welshimeri]|nr:DNA repair protein RadC [Listeria welshimeri]
MNIFVGEVPLCYTNSLIMALASEDYYLHTHYVEALMVMGNGASFIDNDPEHPIIFFDNGLPDISISNCLKTLGFNFEEFYIENNSEISSKKILEKLRSFLKKGVVVVGPLDMGYLSYNPNSSTQYGIDHFVTLIDMDENFVYLHDPAGFPCVKIKIEEFLKSWKAESIHYKRGAFSMWGNIKRMNIPSGREIFNDTALIIKKRYENSETGVIESYANAIKKNGLNKQQQTIHQYFSFRLAAARNLFMSEFLKEFDSYGARIKQQLAFLFGEAHLYSISEEYSRLADTLMEIAKLDECFKSLYTDYKGE